MGNIYLIENIITKERYVGQTRFTTEKRWKQHIKEAYEALDGKRQSFPLFHRMIIKYGEDAFTVITLEECNKEVLDEREQYWIKYYDTYNAGYNRTVGGQNGQVQKHNREVSQFNLSGEYITTFPCAADAAEVIGVSPSSIRHNCNGDTKTCGGFLWQWDVDKVYNNDIPQSVKIECKILQIDEKGNIVGEYKSMKEASRQTGINYAGIYNCCRNAQNKAGGYKWKKNI